MRREDFRGKATGVIDLSKAGDKVALKSVMGSQGASPTFLGEESGNRKDMQRRVEVGAALALECLHAF